MRAAWLLALAACSFPSLPELSATKDGAIGDGKTDAPSDGPPPGMDPSVLTHHHDNLRDGMYIDPAFTASAVMTGLHRDPGFTPAAFTGPVFAQPLFLAGTGGDPDLLIIATEQNVVMALDASTGAIEWMRTLANPVSGTSLPCGNINPTGITATPVIDPATGTLYVAAMALLGGGPKQMVYAMSAKDGTLAPSPWPVDVGASITGFMPGVQQQAGALAVANGRIYVPYGALLGDCGNYNGWVVSISTADPSQIASWSTTARGGAVEGPNGVVVDGTSVFVATGNSTGGPTTWSGNEAVLRLASDLTFSGANADFFAPTNWQSLDLSDADLGDSGVLPVTIGATKLAVAFGKDHHAYFLDRTNLGGVSTAAVAPTVTTQSFQGSPATYTTPSGTIVAFTGKANGCTGELATMTITSTSPVTVSQGWCADPGGGHGSPIVTTTDGITDPIVWSIGIGGDLALHAFDGKTGTAMFMSTDAPPPASAPQLPIVAHGRIYVVGDTAALAYAP